MAVYWCTKAITGVSGAGPIWHYFMRTVLAGEPEKPFPQPDGLVEVEVCDLSGLLPTDDCPFRQTEWFIQGTQPVAYDSFYQRVEIDKQTGYLATEETSADDVVPQLALNIPPVLHPWARAEEMLVLDDLLLASGSRQNVDAFALRLVSPDPNTRYRLTKALPAEAQQLPVEVVGTADLKDLTLWVDGKQIITFSSSPYKTWWPLVEGQHTMWVEGADGNGEVVKSEVLQFEVMAPIMLSE